VSEPARSENATLELQRMLERGVRGEDLDRVRALLGLSSDSDEVRTVRALVGALAEARVANVRFASAHSADKERGDPSRIMNLRASSLMRLKTSGEVGSVDIHRSSHVPTLLAVLRAGSLSQRRAAADRLGALLEEKAIAAPHLEQLSETLQGLRTFAIAYEVGRVVARLPGQAGRAASVAERKWSQLLGRVERGIGAFWDGEASDEPLRALDAEDRAHLLSRVRDLPDEVVRHIAAVVGGSDVSVDARDRWVLLAGLQSAGDARLLPVLRALVDSGEGERLLPAIRALGRIDDPRTHPILKAAFARTAIAEHRVVLAGALGLTGDARGLPYAREALATRDERLLPYALEALAYLGGAEDVLAVSLQLEHDDPERQRAAVETLGRIGDGRALHPLAALCSRSISSALRADAEEAIAAIRARLELLGEEPPGQSAASQSFDTAKMAALVRRRRDPATVRLRSRLNVWLGHVWLGLGAQARAIRRLEAASALRPDWAAPIVTVAMVHARTGQHAQALAGFRRALEIDRAAVEKSSSAAEMVAQVFLRRAEAVESADIARGLLEEALALDLRKVSSGLRFALSERLTALKLSSGR
jgi:tetratricopeptide (TPR) repeat protein